MRSSLRSLRRSGAFSAKLDTGGEQSDNCSGKCRDIHFDVNETAKDRNGRANRLTEFDWARVVDHRVEGVTQALGP